MSKDNRSGLNPFTGKTHYDTVNDDKFLDECYCAYYEEIGQYQLLDETPDGQLIFNIVSRLVNTVEDYLYRIGRLDYVDGYYDWEVHLVNSNIANACCYPGGKIIVYAGLLSYIEREEEIAFILGHEIAHALLDHSRTKVSSEQTRNTVSSATWLGSIALDLMGFNGAADLTRAAVNVANLTSHYFLTQPWGRDQELEADKLGLIINYLAGYNVSYAPSFWKRFSEENLNDFDFFSTHPSDEKRIQILNESLSEIIVNNDFYSHTLLPETPKPKKHYNNVNFENQIIQRDVHSTNLDTKYCPECGTKAKTDDIFCSNCGCKLG